jgi:hypothetical protein
VCFLRTLCCSLLFIPFLVTAQLEAKVNLPLLAVVVPNIGLEVQLASKRSMQLDVLGSFWDAVNGSPLHINQTFLEYRFYSKSYLEKWFIAPHLGYGMFTLQKPYKLIIYDHYSSGASSTTPNTYQHGRIFFHGITLGYKKRLNKNWALEAFIGAGYTLSWYRAYNETERTDVQENNRPFNGSSEFLIYRGGLMLSYTLPKRPKIKNQF